MTRRTDRINELLREELSDLIRQEVKDPRVSGIVSITEVQSSQDLHYSRVYVSIMGTDAEKDDTIKALTTAAGFLRRELASRLKLRSIPELNFMRDDSIEKGARLLELIKKANSNTSGS